MKKTTLCLMLILTLILPGVVQATDVTTENVARIGETEYATIADAIEAVPVDNTETTITLLKDVEKGTGFKTISGQNIVIDFAGHTYDAAEPLVGSTGTVTNGCQLRKGSTVTFKNGTLVTTSQEAGILIQNYSNLTLDDMIIDATESTSEYAMSNNSGKVNIIGETSIIGNKYAFDMCWAPNKGYPEGTQIKVNTTGTITGDIELGVWGEFSDTDGIKSTLAIENINHVGNIVVSEPRLSTQATISGGTFSSDVQSYLAPAHVCEKTGSNYTVYKIHNIFVDSSEGGKANSDRISGKVGTHVGLDIIPDEGYEFREVIVADDLGTELFRTANQYFFMPDSDVRVKVVFGKETPKIEISGAVEDAEKAEEIIYDSLFELEDEKFETIMDNNNVQIKIEVTEDKVDEIRKQEIENALKEEIKVAKYLDITIAVKEKDTGVLVDTIDELKEKISFSVTIPEDLPEVAEGFARKYYIIRNHNGIVEYLDAILSEDGKTLSFETDKFSAYALAYSDEKITTSEGVPGETVEQPKEDELVVEDSKTEETNTDIPNTGDNIVLYVLLAIVAICGIFVAKKVNTKNSKH